MCVPETEINVVMHSLNVCLLINIILLIYMTCMVANTRCTSQFRRPEVQKLISKDCERTILGPQSVCVLKC